jgi:hypothetical protein
MEQRNRCPPRELAHQLEQSLGELGRLGLLVLDDLDDRVRSVTFIDRGTHIHDWPTSIGSFGLHESGDERVMVRDWLRRQLKAEILYQDGLASIWSKAVEERVSKGEIRLPDHWTGDDVPVRLGLAALRPAPEALAKLVNWLCSVDSGEEQWELAHGKPEPARPPLRFTGTAGGLSAGERLKAKGFREWGVLVIWPNQADVLAAYLESVTAEGRSSHQPSKVGKPSKERRGTLSKDRCALVLVAIYDELNPATPPQIRPDADRQRAAFEWACENKGMNIRGRIKAIKRPWLPEWFVEDLLRDEKMEGTVEDLLRGTKCEEAFRQLVRNALTHDQQRHPRQRASRR